MLENYDTGLRIKDAPFLVRFGLKANEGITIKKSTLDTIEKDLKETVIPVAKKAILTVLIQQGVKMVAGHYGLTPLEIVVKKTVKVK